ncbi:hypothetical protein BBAL3_248 [Brevundimonas sp. BAL3]|uniref:hypothetical protein n=1 Tax=Brevundimonas sp. BAL3 TaxID=391600 RepID=UPI00017EC6F1|nr:hypothetical protein [Brevundimonas sp. BAL3]EDX79091.1 hypothetical protein BBAL3_248 [Brevundimonas sp. BAL3]
MPHRLAGMPPFGLLARVLSADAPDLNGGSRVTVDSHSLLQLIALAALSGDKAQVPLSQTDQLFLEQYFSGAAPADFEVDEALYLEVNQDVAAATAVDPTLTAKRHFEQYGFSDGRAPNLALRPLFKSWLNGDVIKWKGALPPASSQAPTLERQVAGLCKKSGIDFIQGLEALPYFRAPVTHPLRAEFAQRLTAAAPELPERDRVVVLTWLTANRDHALIETILPSLMAIDESVLPSAAKAMVEYSGDTGQAEQAKDQLLGRFMASESLRAFLAGDSEVFADALVRGHAAELAAHFMPASSPRLPDTMVTSTGARSQEARHLFVGFFGQMRFPETTVPALIAQAQRMAPESHVSIAFSTWNRSGVRMLEDADPVYFATEQLPPPFAGFCETASLASGRDFCDLFPAIGARLRERARARLEITQSGLEALAEEAVLTDIADDETFRSGPGEAIAKAFPGQAFMLNQGRMWNRIASLRPLLRRAEQQKGVVTDVLLMRPDIRIDGDLAEIFGDTSLSGRPMAYVDYDAHATFLGGVGDRIFFTSPNVAHRLFDGEDIMQIVTNDSAAILDTYRWFLVPHRYPQTLLFEHGAQIRQVGHEQLKMHIFRGQIELKDIIDALRQDRDGSPDLKARDFLNKLCPT